MKDEVHVWAPSGGDLVADPGVRVHSLPLGYGPRGLLALSRALRAQPSPQRFLVQYVPQAFGLRGVNLPFCAWLASMRRAEVFVMFHEVAVPWAAPRRWEQNAGAAAMRAMAALLLARADRVFVSTSSWEPVLRSLAVRWNGATWLPVPSNIPVDARGATRATSRARLGIEDGVPVIGHFGTYGRQNRHLVASAVRSLLEADPRRVALLIGYGSDTFACGLGGAAATAGRVVATGAVDIADVAGHVLACDFLVQPYPDGVSTRRTSAMAGLALGIPIATNEGHLTEPLWRASGAVEIAARVDGVAGAAERLLADPAHAADLGRRGRQLYEQRFSLDHVIRALRV
jgi:glycosyltransferase involved in cell wall biosynthesis